VALVLKTTSQVISKHSNLEEKQAKNYEHMAETFPNYDGLFKIFVKENQKHVKMVLRVYQEGVTDAYEVGFLAEPLNVDDYLLHSILGKDIKESVEKLIHNEKKLIKFYSDISKGTSKLLPSLPETFEYLISRKNKRIDRLEKIFT
jgi:rubrerythrin